MAAVDELFELRNAFYLGNYSGVISEAAKLRPKDPSLKAAKEAFVYRAYIAQGKFSVPLDEIKPGAGSSPGLAMLRNLALYQSAPQKRLAILDEVEAAEKRGLESDDVLFYLAGAQIYMAEGNLEAALRLLHAPDDLEASALRVHCLLRLDRPELAAKEVKRMMEKDEDATLTNLATAWVNLAAGKEKLQEAFYIFQEMMDKYGETGLLQVAQATACLLQGRAEEAEALLQSALQREPNNADALANMAAVQHHLGKAPESARRFLSQLKEADAAHPAVKDALALEESFDRIAAAISA